MRYCPNCGAQVSQGTFCGQCGASLTATGAADAHQSDSSPYPAETATSRASSRALPIGLALVVIGLLALGVWWFVAGRGQQPVPSSGAVAPTASSTTTAATPGGSTSAPEGTETPTGAASGSTTLPAPGGASAPAGSWILVLDSLNQSTNSLEVANTRAAGIPGSVVVDSSQTPGLNGGYWAIVSKGYYGSKDAASADCGTYGRSASGACYPRRIG